MTVLNTSPGRRSISHATVGQGRGQNQGVNSSGCVQPAQIASAGKSTKRLKD